MAEGRRSSRAHKTVNYAKLDYGSEEDDDFKPAEAPPSKRPKPAVKEAPKKAEKRTKPDSRADTSSSAVNEKQKTGRASLDDKLFQRDLEAALRLSQNAPVSEGQCHVTGAEGKPADSIVKQNDLATFPENLELAGEVVVQSEPAPDTCKPSASPGGDQEEDYQPEQEESSEDEEDSASDEDYGDDGSDDDEEFAPSKSKAPQSRKEPVAKKSPAAPKKVAGEWYHKSRGQENCITVCTTTLNHKEPLSDTWQSTSVECAGQFISSVPIHGKVSTSPRYSTKVLTKCGFAAFTATNCSHRKCAHDCAQVFNWPVASVRDSARLVTSFSEQATAQFCQGAAVNS
ncbi:hypothetical protein HPB50_005021 [Hyalomma asiaticum]|uniref:Uncharacterized protein n=1 Tax=Hyalomma asiaticum TaxID=266040 RepID=A0ACB7SMU8_HYAAI|nr:hypothetical protein HPB50_005021 [Hyalomma asiaticum]